MNRIPIAFAFDNNLILPACVCISSLLMSAKPDTFYDIFILHSPKEELTKEKLDLLPHYYSNCRLQYRKVDATFDDAFEIRGITTPTYYRLLIPDLIPEYDKVIYSDVDVIFRMDLSQLYQSDLAGYLLAATKDLGLNLSKEGKEYIVSTLGLIQGNYLQAGFIIMNNALMRKDKKEKQLKALAKQKYKHQDQDILNIACQGKVLYLPPCYNMTNYSYNYMLHNYDMVETLYTDEEIRFALSHGNIHYNGQKPWKGYCINFDIWWEYYRKSPFFDEKFYYDFFAKKLDEYDRLSLWKRIKILGRYFIHGRTDN